MKIFFKVLLVFFLNCQLFLLFSDEYNVYKEFINKFDVNKGPGTFRYYSQPPDIGPLEGPNSFTIDTEGNFYICDTWNKRIEKYNLNFLKRGSIIINEEYHYASASQITYIDNLNKIITSAGVSSISKINFDGKILFQIIYDFNKWGTSLIWDDFIEYKNYLFQYLEGGGIVCFVFDKENNYTLLENEQVKAMFNPGSGYDIDGLTIDDKNRLFLNGELQTRNYKTFYEYWNEKHKELGQKQPELKITRRAENYIDRYTDPIFIGKDKMRNFYWSFNRDVIIIFNKSGFLVDVFLPENYMSGYKTLPAIHPSGDVYFLDYDTKGAYLYRVKNVWDPETREKWYAEYGETPGKN